VTNATLGLGANVGARLLFENQFNVHNTVDITMNGTLAAANNGANYLQVDFFTIPDGTTFLDGDIALTGAADRNFIISDSVGNYSVVEQGNTRVSPATKLVIGGQITGAGGFTKLGGGEVRLTNNNTFTGDLNVLRLGTSAAPWESHTYKINGVDYATNGLAEGWAEWGLTLNGTLGAVSDVANINLQRRGMITLDNTGRLNATSGVIGGNNNNRVADDVVMNLNQGWFRINGGTVNNTEVLGTVNSQSGTNLIDLYPTDGAGTNMTLTIGTLNRSAGSLVRFNNLDATSTFSTSAAGESVRVAVGTLGATLIGTDLGATDNQIVIGVLGGTIPIGLDTDLRLLAFNNGNITDLWNQQRNLQFLGGSHFMTMDGGFLRPLDDSEYFTAANGLLTNTLAGGLNQNVNLNDIITVMKEDTTVNALRFGALADNNGSGGTVHSGTNLSGYTDHHAVNLYVDGTLSIASGMISSATFAVGNTADATTYIIGGNLDFGAREAILNSQNGFYRTTDGVIGTAALNIRSNILGTGGLLKTGASQVVLAGNNSYTGLTTISEGDLQVINGRTGLGAGGVGNGVVIEGSGSLSFNNGIQVGTAAAPEDILVKALSGDQQILRNFGRTLNYFGDIIIDNVDIAGHAIFTPRIRIDNNANTIINGDIYGGTSAVINDITQIDSRVVQFDSTDSGQQAFIFRGQFGDRGVAGAAAPIANPISTKPTDGSVTNENEVLRVNLTAGNDATSFYFDQQYNAAGRLTLGRGVMLVNYDPTVGDGSGFWTNTAIAKIPNADSLTTTFAVNGGTASQGFIMGNASNTVSSLFMTRAGQVFNMASWGTAGTGAKYIGGLNETGTVTFGNGTGTIQNTDATVTSQFYAMGGGTVVVNARLTGNTGTAPAAFGYVKNGRGTMEVLNSTAGAGTAQFILAGGTLVFRYSGATPAAMTSNQNVRFDGGTLLNIASTAGNTTTSLATDNAADRVVNFSVGGNEIIARTTNTGTARNMTVAMGNGNANGSTPTSNFLRSLGTTVNFVEDQAAGGTAQITLNFNATSTAAQKNQVIPWASFGTAARTATDFAMVDAGAANDVRAFGRAADEFQNSVAAWGANWDVSENGGAGFSGALGGALTLSTIRFDANADSVVDLGTNVLTVAGNGLASSGGGILISSNVGAANKTITGTGAAALTTTGGNTELIIHHYGTGNLNVNVPITGAGVDLTINGPSTVDANTIGTSGAVVLNAANTYTGRTFINGAVLSISDVSQIGTTGAFAQDQITFGGGTLRYTGSGLQSLGFRGVTITGAGGTFDITDGAGELRIAGNLANAGLYRGDLIKVGAGTLTLEGDSAGNNTFAGLIDVRQGTLRLNSIQTAAAGTTTILGSNNSAADGTIFRSGTSFAIQMSNGNNTGDYNIDEWLTFENNTYVTVGSINTGAVNPSGWINNPHVRAVNLNGVVTVSGTTTFDTLPSEILRISNGAGFLTGNGDIVKDGQGTMEFRSNNPDWTGNLIIKQGTVYQMTQADPLGTGYLTGKTITLGSNDRQGLARLYLQNVDNIQNGIIELNHDINVAYSPTQTKQLSVETVANGTKIEINGDITLNDSLLVYINDGAETGGSQNYMNFNGQLKDGLTTSGNITIFGDDGGSANDNTSGRPVNYAVLKGDNSAWTGDVFVSANTSYDQDQTTVVRLEHANALGAANDVTLNFNSILQVGGGARTIGGLTTNGGTGNFYGNANAMYASTNGSSEIIENAASTAGTLTITQTTPAGVEADWNAHFRDGTLNSQFFAPGTNTHQPSAALNIVKAGDGWATLSVDNNYTGTTTVTAGNLQVGRAGIGDTGAENAAGISVGISGTLSGTGIVQGGGTVDGNLRPGDLAGAGVGMLTFNGNTILNSTAVITLQIQRASFNAPEVNPDASNYASVLANLDTTYSFTLADPVLATQHDKIVVMGSLAAAGGGAKFILTNNGYTPVIGDVFNLVDWTGAALASNTGATIRGGGEGGTDLDLFSLGSGFYWDTSLFASEGVLVVVPEPNALSMLAGSLGLALGLQRFRRRRLS